MLCNQRIHNLAIVAAELHCSEDRLQRTFPYAEIFVDKFGRVQLLSESQTVTGRACSERSIKREHSRLQFFHADTVIRTGQLGAEGLFVVMVVKVPFHLHQPVAVGYGKLAGLGNSSFLSGFNYNSVHNDFYGMLEGLFQLDFIFINYLNLTVNPYTGKAFLLYSLNYLFVSSLALTNDRSHYHHLGAFLKPHYGVDHLVHRLTGDRLAADRAVRFADSGVKQSQVVVNLSYRSHSRTRVSVSSGLWKWPEKALRCIPHRAFPSVPGTVGHMRKGSPCIVSVPLHIWYQKQGMIFPIRRDR